jgi:membrane peptidoglycan carboxypeptidase
VISGGTGTRAQLPDGRPAAGKTGTTQAARDAWFIGFTADYVVGVWMGYDDNTPLSGTTGGGLPAEIWRETMVRIEDGLPIRPLPDRVPTTPVAVAVQTVPNAVANVETAVKTVVQNVLNGLFGRN